MRKTKAQREFHQEMKAINQETGGRVKPYKRRRKSFTETKFFYYGIRILLILAVIRITNIIDLVVYGLLGH